MGIPEEEMENTISALKRSHNGESDDIAGKPKRKKMSQMDKEKAPTAQEMRQLKETENLYNTNLFRMQMTELLAEVRMKKRQQELLKQEVEKLKDILLNLSTGKERQIHQQKWLKSKGVSVPIVQEPKVTKGRFQLQAPTRVFLSGSMLLNTCVQPSKAADLIIEMPKECFKGKDFLNHRYLRKRALYLAAIAAQLLKVLAMTDIKYTYHGGNPYKPILVLNMKGTGKPLTFHLHAVPEEGAFKLSRFHISKNNIRPNWFSGIEQEEADDEGSGLPPTPVYNTSILQDICFSTNAEFLMQHLTNAPNLQDGISLLKVWLHQRQLDQGYGSFTGFLMSMYVCYLLNQRQLNRSMSSYQILRNTLLTLSTSDWGENPITLCSESGEQGRPQLDQFQKEFDVVFVDVSGYVNLCLGMTKSFHKRVTHEAKLAMDCLKGQVSEHFDPLLMVQVPFLHKFDQIFHVKLYKDTMNAVIRKCHLSDRLLDHGGNLVATITPSMLNVLSQGLGDRVELIQMQQLPTPEWSLAEDPPSLSVECMLTFGLVLHKTNSLQLLDRGPPANSPEAVEFRQFWGEKSELRRFKDGGIAEAVVWSTSTCLNQKRAVCSKIISHVLHRHTDIHPDHIHHVGRLLEQVLYVPRRVLEEIAHGESKEKKSGSHSAGDLSYGTGEERHYRVRQVLEELGHIIRRLSDLPLSITSVTGTSPACRFTEVFPPQPAIPKLTSRSLLQKDDGPLPIYTPSLEVVCKLEGSGKWPEDLEAIRRLKAAYCAKLGEDLENLHDLTVSITPTHVDVLKDGFVFRLKLGLNREIGVLKMVKTPEGMLRMEDTPEALKLEFEVTTLPKITIWLQGLQQDHQSFCATVRLVKRWMSAQMLLGHISEITVEKTVAYLYEKPLPYTSPVSPLVGLLRFLKFVSKDEYKVDEYTDKTLPVPPAVIVNRLRALAHESLKVLEERILHPEYDWKTIFRPPLEGYDILIYLSSKWLPRRFQAVDVTDVGTMMNAYASTKTRKSQPASTKTRKSQPAISEMPVTDFDPVKNFIQELNEELGEFCLIFHDQYGGDVVALLWKPGTLENKDFKLQNVKARKPVVNDSSEVVLKLNIDAIVDDIKVIGNELVSKVEVKSKLV